MASGFYIDIEGAKEFIQRNCELPARFVNDVLNVKYPSLIIESKDTGHLAKEYYYHVDDEYGNRILTPEELAMLMMEYICKQDNLPCRGKFADLPYQCRYYLPFSYKPDAYMAFLTVLRDIEEGFYDKKG